MSEEIKKQLQDLLRKLLSQGLPEEEAIKIVEAEKQKLLGLEKTKGVARPAATVAPKRPAAASGLASGTSLSESQRLVAPIAKPPVQKDKPEGYIDYFKAEDLLENEEDINSKFKGQLNSLGIQIDEANIGNGIILSSGSGKFIPGEGYGAGRRDLTKTNKIMKVNFPTKEQELLVRLKLIQNSIRRVLHQVDKGTLEIPKIKGYSLITELNDIDELCDLNQNYFQEWKETKLENNQLNK